MEKYLFKLVEIQRKDETNHQKYSWKDLKYSYPEFMCIGKSASIPMSDGRWLNTSVVVDFQLHKRDMIIETRNTKYIFTKEES